MGLIFMMAKDEEQEKVTGVETLGILVS